MMSGVPAPITPRIETRLQRRCRMLREAAALEKANGTVSGRTRFRTVAVVPWRALVAAALLSLVLGAALFQGVAGERSSVVPAVRLGDFSHQGLLSVPFKRSSLEPRPFRSPARLPSSTPAAHTATKLRARGGALKALRAAIETELNTENLKAAQT